MAKIDVSELMLDPDFCDSLTLIRRTYTVNNFGEPVFNETSMSVYGSFQGARKEDIARLPEGVSLSNFKTFYTKTVLNSANSSQYPDILVYMGERYTIENITPWGNFGAGWYMCDCVRERVGQ